MGEILSLKSLPAKLGVKSFRGVQEDVISSIGQGQDTLALAATGMGKTLCYQASSLLTPSWTLVVSPLLALMDDQLNSCLNRGLEAFAIRGDMEQEERLETIEKLLSSNGILFASPEIINAPHSEVSSLIQNTPPGLVVFDEAHCISAWGHGFRPDYAKVGRSINSSGRLYGGQKPRFPMLAMTATATDEIIADIVSSLGLQMVQLIKGNTHRETISIEVKAIDASADNLETALPYIKEDLEWFGPKRNGVIYCRKRKDVDFLFEALKDNFNTAKHHSGMDASLRQINSQRFLDGHASIMIATIGFGMGLDRGDIDFVLHVNPAATPEEWAQEAGRGGRDGRHSWSVTYLMPGFSRAIRTSFKNRAQGYGQARKYVSQLLGLTKNCHNNFLRKWNGGPEEGPAPAPCCDICSPHKTKEDYLSAAEHEVIHLLQTIQNEKTSPAPIGFLEDCLFAEGFIDFEEVQMGDFSTIRRHISYRGIYYLHKDRSFAIKRVIPSAAKTNRSESFASKSWREMMSPEEFREITSGSFKFEAKKRLSKLTFNNFYEADLGKDSLDQLKKNTAPSQKDLGLDFSL